MSLFDERDARVEKALAEAQYVKELISDKHAEVVLAAEVRRLKNVQERVATMIESWREMARYQRSEAAYWRTQGESLVWHAIRLEARAEILEVQAQLLESILTTR